MGWWLLLLLCVLCVVVSCWVWVSDQHTMTFLMRTAGGGDEEGTVLGGREPVPHLVRVGHAGGPHGGPAQGHVQDGACLYVHGCGCMHVWMRVDVDGRCVSNENDNIPALITPNQAHAQIKPIPDRRWTPRTPPTRPRRSASSSRTACPSRYAGRYECLYVCVHVSGLEAAIKGPPRMATLPYTHPHVNTHKPRW